MHKAAPPLSKADRIKRHSKDATAYDIAAIDFGTTFCSLAYTCQGDKDVNTLKLDGIHQRVPNAVLLKQDGPNYTVVQFGYKAQEEYSKMRASDRDKHIYFERMKMILERDEDIDRQSIIKSFGVAGQSFYLVEVIAHILKYLKEKLDNHLYKINGPVSFHWVITVPAIWRARGKRMMREAAYMAGLFNPQSSGSSNFITIFTEVGRGLPRPDESNKMKLKLALEPECAAIYSQHVTNKAVVSSAVASQFKSKDYMVIDVGGGTVDITAHHQEDDRGIEVIIPPTGNSWGGTKVNEEFNKLLEAIVDDKGLDHFLSCGSMAKKATHKAALNKLVYSEFEQQKVIFGENVGEQRDLDGKESCINLPAAFIEFYGEDKIQDGADKIDGVSFDDDSLYITYSKMSKLFSNAIKGIIECTMHALDHIKEPIGNIYLVGGFGGCKYVHASLKHAIDTKGLDHKPHVIVPPNPSLAIATGAVMWRQDPSMIMARRSDATYGTCCCVPFTITHNSHYRYFDREDGMYRTDQVFSVYLETGERISADDIFINTYAPGHHDTKMLLPIYSTSHRGIQYIKDENNKFNVRLIGQIIIKIPNPDSLPNYERTVEVTMDFSGTEIQATAKYCVTGEVVSTICDFLSAQLD